MHNSHLEDIIRTTMQARRPWLTEYSGNRNADFLPGEEGKLIRHSKWLKFQNISGDQFVDWLTAVVKQAEKSAIRAYQEASVWELRNV